MAGRRKPHQTLCELQFQVEYTAELPADSRPDHIPPAPSFGIGDGLPEHSRDVQEHCFVEWLRDTLVLVWRQRCYNTKCNVTDTKVVESERTNSLSVLLPILASTA